MNIAIVGTGYVGLVTGACLAEAGNHVYCIDTDAAKIARLSDNELPFYEPGLADVVRAGTHRGQLRFTCDLGEGTRDADAIFLAVGTPATADGHADIANLFECATQLAGTLNRDTVVVVKSTAPAGTCERIQNIFDSRQTVWAVASRITVACNPEFLAEGRAVEDFRRPERIVIGTADDRAESLLRRLYAPFDPTGTRLLHMNVRSAEFAKYACNAMLAARVSLINELAGIAAQLGADIQAVCQVLRSDSRIGPKYLQPGAGFGGSCLPKDLLALIGMAQDHDEPAEILRSVEHVNNRQRELLFDSISRHFSGRFVGRCVAVWGLAFKPGTDDIRASPSLTLIHSLLVAGARVRAYDPVAEAAVRNVISHPCLELMTTAQKACDYADVLAVMTEWDEFKAPDFERLAGCLKMSAIFDARNIYDPETLQRYKLRHYTLGQRHSAPPSDSRDGVRHAACYGIDAGGPVAPALQSRPAI